MSKKIVSVFMALLMLFSLCPLSAFAAEETEKPGAKEVAVALKDDFEGVKKSAFLLKSLSKSLLVNIGPYIENIVLTPENIEKVKQSASKIMAKLIDKITNPSKPDDPSNPDCPSKPEEPSETEKEEISVEWFKKVLERYIFVKVDDVDAAALKIINNSDVDYELVTDSDGTVYIGVDVENNPEIFNFFVFRNVVDGLYAAQGEELLKNNNGGTDYAMSYEHIAGELALHAIVFAVTNEAINVTGTKNSLIVKMYEKAAVAALNYDEERLPSEIMSMLGVLLMDLFQFNLLKLFGLL